MEILLGSLFILQLSIIAIIVERVSALFVRRKLNQMALAKYFEDPIRKGEIKSLIEKTEKITSMPIARATLVGAKSAQMLGGADEIRGKMDEVLFEEKFHLRKRTGLLLSLAIAAILTGLLGSSLEVVNGREIADATSLFVSGLTVAIPAFLMFALLQSRAQALIEDLDLAALKVFNWLSYAYEPAGFQSLRGRPHRGAELEV